MTSQFVTTNSSVRMPRLIYGTAWKKDQTAPLVTQAILQGFRGIDTGCQPKHYSESEVGTALKDLFTQHGLKRSDLYIQTKFTSIDGQDPNKIPYDKHANLTDQVKQSLDVSLRNLSLDFIDSLLLHSPMQTLEETLEVWTTFESFVDAGKVRQLGISNCYSLKSFKKIYDKSRIKPAVLQNRFYNKSGYDKELRQFCKEKNIFYQSFWTLTANPKILKSNNVVEIAKKWGKTPEQMFLLILSREV